MWTWLAIAAVIVGAFHAAASFFFFSRRRHGLVWALAWGAATAAALVLHDDRVATGLFWGAVLVWQVWWWSIRPRLDRDWAPELARQVTGTIADGRLTLRDVRNFTWRGEDDFDERWEVRTYDLDRLASIDLFASYWTSPTIAHLIVSFGFEDRRQLAFSIEVRRERDEPWSGVGGLFKVFEMVTIAADERDVIRLRTDVRNEDVRLYRLRSTPEFRRRLLAAYVADCNRLAREPRFFHTLWTNCTTQVIRFARAAGGRLPFDWRMIASGLLPDYLHRIGLLDDRRPFAELRARAAISARARTLGDDAFSAGLREGVPRPDDGG